MRGEHWDKAALYGTRAGIRAGDRSAPPQVQKAYFETAIDAFGRLPQTPDTVAHTIEVRCLIGAALFSLNERDAFAQHMEIARSLAERLGNEERLVRVLANQTNALWFSGELPRARETGERALALAQSKGLREHRIHAGVNLGIVLQSAGDARKAIDLFAGVISLLQGDLERQRLGRTLYPASFARNELAACRAELGDFDGAFETVHEAIRLAESIDHPPTVLAARLGQGLILARRGHYPSAIATVEAALEGMRAAAGLAAMSLAAGAVLAHCHCALGRADEGIPLLGTRSTGSTREGGDPTRHACTSLSPKATWSTARRPRPSTTSPAASSWLASAASEAMRHGPCSCSVSWRASTPTS